MKVSPALVKSSTVLNTGAATPAVATLAAGRTADFVRMTRAQSRHRWPPGTHWPVRAEIGRIGYRGGLNVPDPNTMPPGGSDEGLHRVVDRSPGRDLSATISTSSRIATMPITHPLTARTIRSAVHQVGVAVQGHRPAVGCRFSPAALARPGRSSTPRGRLPGTTVAFKHDVRDGIVVEPAGIDAARRPTERTEPPPRSVMSLSR